MLKYFLITFSLFSVTFATEKADKDQIKPNDELIITSRHLDYDYSNRRAVFNRDVRAVNNDTVMTAEKMTCFFNEENQPYLVIAEDDINIVRGALSAKANKATYKVNEKQIILRNQPELFDGKNTIKGRVITFLENKREAEVLDAEAYFIAKSNQLSKKPKQIKKP